MIHNLFLLLIPLAGIAIAFLIVIIIAKPLALRAYLRAVQAAQEPYRKLYLPFVVLPEQDIHHIILGVPGAGKTMLLHMYEYVATQKRGLIRGYGKIPVYVPLKKYHLFLKTRQHATSPSEDSWVRPASPRELLRNVTLIDFLCESDLLGMRHLRRYLKKLTMQGRIVFLCDGLNEVDSHFLGIVSAELEYLLRWTSNRLLITALDYHEQPLLAQLVDDGQLVCTRLQPLQPEQVREFVEHIIAEQGARRRHTAGQIMEVINRSRLRSHCTNPMMLFALTEVIDDVGVQGGKQIDTRGQLLRQFVSQCIARERRQATWDKAAPTENTVLAFLSAVACAARWANERNAIKLRISTAERGKAGRTLQSEALTEALQVWLNEHPPQGPFAIGVAREHESYNRGELVRLTRVAQGAGLIDISADGVLSFRHELVAEYLVAAYFSTLDSGQQPAWPFREDLLADAAGWSELVALWAGLLDDPLLLAERLTTWGRGHPAYVLEALSLGLVCIGVLWTPPQAERQHPIVLPSSIKEVLAETVRDTEACEKLARLFTRCAEQGAQEIYSSLLPLLEVEGIDKLLVLLDQALVPDMLFKHLADVADDAAYEAQVKRLTRVLARCGEAAVVRATEWGIPEPGRSLRLRAAMINILGGTNEEAVEPLIARLSDPEPYVRGRAISALIRLGPERTLSRLIEELQQHAQAPGAGQLIHWAVLMILERFLDEQDARRRVDSQQRQRILQAAVSVLRSQYPAETQQQALEMLVRQGSDASRSGEGAVEKLIDNLSSENDETAHSVIRALQMIGAVATPQLLAQLEQQPSETVRRRIVAVFEAMSVLDQRALPHLLHLLADPAPLVQQQAAGALRLYAPASIPGLIQLVLFDADEAVAARAAQVLGDIGGGAVVPMVQALPEMVPGRTHLLVQVLEHVHDPQAIPALIALLETPGIEPLLAMTLVHALGQYPDARVVPLLIAALASSYVQVYEEAVNALSSLGQVALPELIAALDVEEETLATPRVRRALLGMIPFPGEQLIAALAVGSEAQAEQIMAVLLAKGSEAAPVLVTSLVHPDERVQGYARRILTRMEGRIVVPALLEVLHYPTLRPAVEELLHRYSQEAIPPLVHLLGDPERGDVAAAILLDLGPAVLPSLVPGLDDANGAAQARARSIIVNLVHDDPDVLSHVVHLFSSPLPQRAREELLAVLTNELAEVSIPVLLAGLEDVYLLEGVSEAFARLIQKHSAQSDSALNGLFAALRIAERQRGARIVLANAGGEAVPSLINLIADSDQVLAQAARDILRDIGVAAFPAIWAASSDVSNRARREAALNTFRRMPSVEIKDGLVEHLMGDKLEDISMALGLLLERIADEASLPRANQEMIQALLEHVQTQGEERTTRRIIALLLLVGGSGVASHMAWGLYHYHEHPGHQEQLTQAFLLLGKEAEAVLLEMLRYRTASPQLLAEVVGVLGMMTPHPDVYEYVRGISTAAPSIYQTSMTPAERQAVALRALGGLLVGGHLSSSTLQSRLMSSLYGSAEHELYSVLLGKPYGPAITKLENDLRTAQYEYEKDRRQLVLQLGVLEHQKEVLEEENQQLEAQYQQLEATNRRLIESNQRLQEMLRSMPGARTR